MSLHLAGSNSSCRMAVSTEEDERAHGVPVPHLGGSEQWGEFPLADAAISLVRASRLGHGFDRVGSQWDRPIFNRDLKACWSMASSRLTVRAGRCGGGRLDTPRRWPRASLGPPDPGSVRGVPLPRCGRGCGDRWAGRFARPELGELCPSLGVFEADECLEAGECLGECSLERRPEPDASRYAYGWWPLQNLIL